MVQQKGYAQKKLRSHSPYSEQLVLFLLYHLLTLYFHNKALSRNSSAVSAFSES